jgi:hypothetical protein
MSTEVPQYLNKEQIHNLLGEPHAEGLTLVSTESYNEELIAEKIKSFGPQARDLLFDATLNNAIIGYGQKNFGVVKIEDKFLEIHDIYKKYNVLMNLPQGANLGEDELTPNRLMRFFRYDIRDWINKNNTGSYLWRKYSRKDPGMMPICFRGAEYLEDLTPQQADYLIETVMNMDRTLGTNMIDRVWRSFDARGQQYTIKPGFCGVGSGGTGPNTTTTTTTEKQRQPQVYREHPTSVPPEKREEQKVGQPGQQQGKNIQVE